MVAKNPSNVEVRIIDDPTANSILVSSVCVILEQGNKLGTGPTKKRKKRSIARVAVS